MYKFGQNLSIRGKSHLIESKLNGSDLLQNAGPISVLIDGLKANIIIFEDIIRR